MAHDRTAFVHDKQWVSGTMKKLLVATLALAVAACVILSAGAGAQEPAPLRQEDKIAPDVRQALEALPAGGWLPLLVTFEEQTDLGQIEGATRAERRQCGHGDRRTAA